MSTHLTECPGCLGTSFEDHLTAPDRFHGRMVPYHLVRCRSCSLTWMADPPSAGEMDMHYSCEYDRSIAAAGDSSPRRARNRKQTLIQYKKSGAILDLGCSSGSFLKAMGSRQWDLYGIEISAESASRARIESGAQVFVGDILDAQFQPSSLDVITCFHVFEHLRNPREVLTKVREWLNPGGIFFVLVPNIDSAGAHIFRSYWYALELPRHVFHYSPRSLTVMARSVGLEAVSVALHRELFIEQSLRYIVDDVLRALGITPVPLANAAPSGVFFRFLRKAFRLSLLPVLTGLAGFAGDGGSIHAVFQKKSE